MALTAVKVFTALSSSTRANFIRNLLQKMNGTHASPFSLSYECIEAYDGTTRSAPAGGLMSNLPGGHLWRPGAVTDPPANSWIVMRSMGGIVTTKWQIYVRVTATDLVSFGLVPLDDWSVGAGAPSSPTLPSTIIYSETGHRIDTSSYNVLYGVCDEGMLIVGDANIGPTSLTGDMGYIGECNRVHPSVARPFAIQTNWTTTALPQLSLLSPVDDTTIVTATARQTNIDNNTGEALPTKFVGRVAQYCSTTGHEHGLGDMRYRGLCQEDLVSSSAGAITLGPDGANRTLIAFRGTTGGHVIPWDQSIPPNSAGHTLHSELPSTFSTPSGGGAVLHRTLPYLARRLP